MSVVFVASQEAAEAEEAAQRAAVCAEARSWLRTPHHHMADLKGVGVDCAMLLVRVYHAAGIIPAIDPRPYPPDWHLHRDQERYLGWLDQYGQPTEQPGPGDVAIWRFGRAFSHAGILVGPGLMVHSYIKQGCVLADPRCIARPVRHYTLWGH